MFWVALVADHPVARANHAALVARLRDAAGAGSGGVVGLDAVLEALVSRRVDTLVVSDGFEAPGFRCNGCGFLAPKGRTCSRCTATMERCDDVVEDAIQETLTQSGKLTVCVGNADLDVGGRIGALLRY